MTHPTALALPLVLLGLPTAAQDDGSIPARFELRTPPPHYVGQSLTVTVFAVAGAGRPDLILPDDPVVDFTLVGTGVRPITASGIGSVINEVNEYRYDVIAVPGREGRALVPAFRVDAGRRSGATGPLRIEARRPPSTPDRPDWFGGGVGPIEVALEARPEAVRLGDSLRVEILLSGPGARGSTVRPILAGIDRLGLDPEVEALPPSYDAVAASRVFPFRLRPMRGGRGSLGPVRVATFDPGSRRYLTAVSGSLTIRADDPSPFDPSMIEVATPVAEPSGSPNGRPLAIGLAVVLALLATAVAVLSLVVRGRRGPIAARRYAARRSRRLAGVPVGPERARLSLEALAGFLRRAVDRPEGALTPPEARDGVAMATGDPALADRAARLVADCDAVTYSGRDGGALPDDPPAFFRDLSASRPPPSP